MLALYNCQECGSPLLPTPSGSCCPNGHGKLYPPMPREVQTRNLGLLAGLVDCRPGKDGKWIGTEGPFRVKKTRSAWPRGGLQPGRIYALDGYKLLELEHAETNSPSSP